MPKFTATGSLRDKVAGVLDECKALGHDSQDMASAALRAVDEWMAERDAGLPAQTGALGESGPAGEQPADLADDPDSKQPA